MIYYIVSSISNWQSNLVVDATVGIKTNKEVELTLDRTIANYINEQYY
jgi:hypothetical protein